MEEKRRHREKIKCLYFSKLFYTDIYEKNAKSISENGPGTLGYCVCNCVNMQRLPEPYLLPTYFLLALLPW
jgi:hypothetical protein